MGLYRRRIFRSIKIPVPLVIVGNLTVGGTGKSPLVISLVQLLVNAGYSPGVVSRGYRSRATDAPKLVCSSTDFFTVGDEPIVISRETGVSVVVDSDRVRGAQYLVNECGVDIIISDDGLQHLRMDRNVEIVVIDGERRFGNGLLLPAGPLRESTKRLESVDFIVTNGGEPLKGEYRMRTELGDAVNIKTGEKCNLSRFQSVRIIAVAGIARPDKFFSDLRSVGLQPEVRKFPDHHQYGISDLVDLKQATVLMTAKDAVKCERIAGPNWWVVPQLVKIESSFERELLDNLHNVRECN